MPTTDYEAVKILKMTMPSAFGSMQGLVMALADERKNRGKRSIFGKDKWKAAMKKVHRSLVSTIEALISDGMASQYDDPIILRDVLLQALSQFQSAFPNWQDAYASRDELLVNDPKLGIEVIRSLRL